MRSSAQLLVVVLFAVWGPIARAQDTMMVVEVAAFNLPGYAGNVWSSELYATNLGEEPADLEIVEFLPGEIEALPDSGGCEDPRWTLAPGGSFIAPAGLNLCAQRFVGALVLRVGPGIALRSRIVNHGSRIDPLQSHGRPLRGFGQQIVVWPLPGEPIGPGELDFELWPMVWHFNTCTQPRAFDSYVGVVNVDDEPRAVRVGEDGDAAATVIDSVQVPFGTEIEVPPKSWAQYRVFRYDIPFSDCRDPEAVRIRIRTDGPLLVYGSVVDRASQDPRTVLPLLPPSGAVHP